MPTPFSVPTTGTHPERVLRESLQRVGAGSLTCEVVTLPGSPDIVVEGRGLVIFAHGCFWHHHVGCRHARIPATRYPWAEKFKRNRARDARARWQLLTRGWRVVTVWECATAPNLSSQLDAALAEILDGHERSIEIASLDGRRLAVT